MALYSYLVQLFVLAGIIAGLLGFSFDWFAPVIVLVYVGFLFLSAHQTPLVRLDVMSARACRLFVVFFWVFVVLSVYLFVWLLGLSVVDSLLFAFLLVAVHAHGFSRSFRVRELLSAESRYAGLAGLVLPFLLVPFFSGFDFGLLGAFGFSFVLSVGAGVFMGVLLSKVLVRHRRQDSLLSSLVLLFSALLTFYVAQVLGAFGVVAVAVLGLFLFHAPRRLLEERSWDGKFMLLFGLAASFGAGSLVSLPVTVDQVWLLAGVALVFFVSRAVAAVASTWFFFRSGEMVQVAFAPVGVSCLVALLALHGFGVHVPAIITQACVLLVLMTHVLSFVFGVLWRK